MTVRLFVFSVILLLAYVAYAVSEYRVRQQQLLITQADYSRCVTIHNGPLRAPKQINGLRKSELS
jgi:hypothetical protein